MKKIRKLRIKLLEYVLHRALETRVDLVLSWYYKEITEKEYNKYMKIIEDIAVEAMNRLVKLYG